MEFKIEYYGTEHRAQGDAGRWASIIKNFIRPFDLSRAPLFRVGLIHQTPRPDRPSQEGNCEDKYILMLDMHHIATDGISQGVFINDFMFFYEDSKENLPELQVQYKDFSDWQNREKDKGALKRQEEYWIKEFMDEIPVLNLPTDFVRPPIQNFEGSTVDFKLDSEKTKALKKLAKEENSTLFMLLLAIFNIFLSKISSQEDIIIGTPISGRMHSDLQHLIGMFVNTLPLRNHPKGEEPFKGFLKQLRVRTIYAFENQDYPFEDLVEQVEVNREPSRNPLFDTMFALQNFDIPEIEIPGLKLKPYKYEDRISKFDLTLYVLELDENLHFTFEYCTKLFKAGTIERFTGYLKRIISRVLERPELEISGLELISGEERQQILFDFNDTSKEYPKNKTIHQLFEEQVERTVDRIAIVGSRHHSLAVGNKENVQLTYRELNENSNQLAFLLKEKGVLADAIVGIMVERSIEMVIGILGILKSEGAYLPIDPDYPEERIRYMLADSVAHVLLKSPDISAWLSTAPKALLNLSAGRQLNYQLPTVNQLVYVIYTSGSTGKPKGSGAYHRGCVNLLYWFVTEFALNPFDRNLLLTSLSFDLTQKNLYASLITGGILFIPKVNYFDPGELAREICGSQISWINCTPSIFLKLVECKKNLMNDSLSSLRHVFLGGEPISICSMLQWLESEDCQAQIVNTYGPTECTDISNFYRIQFPRKFLESTVPIGEPICNVKLYVLHINLKLIPVGVPGELFIGGDSVGMGYLNQPELTAEKFKKVSFGGKEFPISYLYRTGDLARWLPDGNIDFLGRLDNQVKIRGFRIELGEIENQLVSHDDVKQAVVMAKTDKSGDPFLCAYVVPVFSRRIEFSGLREFLQRKLPVYMAPAYFAALEKIPLTPNGKLDRNALPETERITPRETMAPRNELEMRLIEIWSGVLGIDKDILGIDTNFFDSGGDSMKAVLLISKIHQALDVQVPLGEMFKTATIKGIAAYISASSQSPADVIEKTEEKEYYPLSPAQKRLYILYQMDPESTGYNVSCLAVLEGDLKKSTLEDTVKKLITRHESLRTSFIVMENEPVQRIHDEVEFEIEYDDAKRKAQSAESKEGRQAPGAKRYTSTIKNFIRPFDLFYAPLLRVGLAQLEGSKYLLMLDMHHIISDLFSHLVFIKDFIRLYGGKTPAQPLLQYKDFSRWQSCETQQKEMEKQEAYWLNIFKDRLPQLNMPIDYPRPRVYCFEGEQREFRLDETLTNSIRRFVNDSGVTLNILFLAVYNLLLSKYAQQDDIVVGTPILGRRHNDLYKIIGFFSNMLPIKTRIYNDKHFSHLIEAVKVNFFNAYEKQDYPFDELVWKLGIDRDPGRHPLVETVLVVVSREFEERQLQAIQDLETMGIRLTPCNFKQKVSHFDLMVHITEFNNRIDAYIEYRTALFKPSTIERMTKNFIEILKQVLEDKERRLDEITITPFILTAKADLLQDEQEDWELE